MSWLCVLLMAFLPMVVVVTAEEGQDSTTGDATGWEHLSVTFRKFSPLPTTEKDAKKNNWKIISDGCKDTSPFYGKRYMLGDEHATILIFDVQGRVAGMQMGFKAGEKKYEEGKHGGAYQLIEEADGQKYYYLTAYFTEPNNVCAEDSGARDANRIGDKLKFLVGEEYVEAPLNMKGTEGTKWKKGKCFIYMGMHYWYDISRDMDCGDVFPFFIMYNNEKLSGWGFAFHGMVKSSRVEHPPGMLLGLFFDRTTFPQCLKSGDRSTQHVYMDKVGWFTHLCHG